MEPFRLLQVMVRSPLPLGAYHFSTFRTFTKKRSQCVLRGIFGISLTVFMLQNDTFSNLKGCGLAQIGHEISKPTNCLAKSITRKLYVHFPGPLFCIKFLWDCHATFRSFLCLKTFLLWPSWRDLAHKGHDLNVLVRKRFRT